MAGGIERAVEYAEYLLECSKQKPAVLLKTPRSSNKGKSIHQKLVDLYIEECGRQPEGKELDYATHLLPKLVRRDKLNCLILNLYPANEGYSLMLKAKNGAESETIKLPYEESELLEYVDAAQLPPFLVDLLEKAQVNVFYSGCVIVEVRDYRRSTSGAHDTQFVMLKPTPQSLLCDINTMTNDGHRWTQEDVFNLESQLLLATEEPLCLDPSPSVLLIANKLQYEQKKFNNPMLKRSVRKFTQSAVNRKRKLTQASAPRELKLFDFIHRKKDKNRSNPIINLKFGKPCVDMWKQKGVPLAVPEAVDVEKYAKTLEKPSASGSSTALVYVEEQTLERDPSQDHRMMARIIIRQNQISEMYVGELFLDHDYSNDKQSEGCSCQFPLGTRDNVDKYFEQFKELFTEEGRRSVKITTQRPNQPPNVTFTQTTQSINSTSITITNAQALLKPSTLAATITQNEPSGSSGLSTKRNVPIQLSLSIGPPGSINAATNLISPQSGVSNPSPATVSQSSQQNVNSQQMSYSQSNQSHASSQRIKQFNFHGSQLRSASSPSPVSTPTSTTAQHQIISSGIASQPSSQKNPTPAPTPTPPPASSRTPTPTSSAARRTSTTDSLSLGQSAQNIQQTSNIATYLQGLASSGAITVSAADNTAGASLGQQQQPGLTTNINIANISSLPQNFNIQSLAGIQGMNIANLQGLQNMQVSLTGVSMQGGGIAVPVPITMINTNPSILQNQTGILVSSLPNMANVSSSASDTSHSSSGTTSANQSNTTAVVTSPHSFVTMVTALPASTATSSTVTSTTVSSQVVMSTGLTSNPTTVLPSQSGMLSLPIGLAGNLTQLMPVGTKTQASSGLRTSASLPLLQLQGQQSIQLLNLPQQRGQLKTGIQSSGGHSQQTGSRGVTTTTTVPISTVLTQNLGGQQLTSQQLAALSSLHVGKQGQPATSQITTQQLMQLAGQQSLQQQQQQQQQQQHLPTQLTFQKSQQAQQQLQFHQLHVKPGTSQSGLHTKSKSKKRTTPTPPKN